MLQEKIKKDLGRAIEKATGIKVEKIDLEHPRNPAYGDYSSNFAIAKFEEIPTSKLQILNPLDLAQKIVENVPKRDYLTKAEAVAPGFINFWLSQDFWASQVAQVIKAKDDFGKLELGRGQKVLIEFGQPNTHKLPHVGHFRSYALGESLARILEFSGFTVFRANYQGDIGLFVAKCLWGYQKKIQNSKFKIQNSSLAEKIKFLQEAYVYGSRMYEEKEEAKKEIDELNVRIYQQDRSIKKLWQKTRRWSLAYYAALNQRLDTKYHREYFESQAAQAGKRIVLENLGKVFQKSQGAIIFPGSQYGLHDRVFLTSAGLPTYEAKDLGLIFLKKRDFNYDFSLISTASEQIEYFKVVYQAAGQIVPEEAKKFTHVPFGLVTLTGGKLSSRKGNILSIDELLEKVEAAVVGLMKEKDYSSERIKKLKDILTIGASKYSILKHTPIQDIVFDIKESVVLEGNSGPYLQYTYARAKSILRKAQIKGKAGRGKGKVEPAELVRLLYQFPEAVERAAQNYSPNVICNYLFGLAQSFNAFYESTPVLKAKSKDLKKSRLALVAAAAQILKNGLYLLGIEAPEQM